MAAADDIALADLLGGPDAGWAFWRAALARVSIAVERSADRDHSFCSHPRGEFGRLLRDLDVALGLASTAVTVQELARGEPPRPGQSRELVNDLFARARQ